MPKHFFSSRAPKPRSKAHTKPKPKACKGRSYFIVDMVDKGFYTESVIYYGHSVWALFLLCFTSQSDIFYGLEDGDRLEHVTRHQATLAQ